jgi:hypothetical protein
VRLVVLVVMVEPKSERNRELTEKGRAQTARCGSRQKQTGEPNNHESCNQTHRSLSNSSLKRKRREEAREIWIGTT